jgi:CubicO group peptidase (beta-lactamase class C family)
MTQPPALFTRRNALGLAVLAAGGATPLVGLAQHRSRASAAAPPPAEAFPGIDGFIDAARTAWRVPAFGFAIIKDGAVIHAKGYGSRVTGTASAVTPDSAFGIASVSKMVTAASIAIGVDKGIVAWDEPVSTYLPGFRLSGGARWDGVTLRDMLSHRTGLPRHDLLWYNNEGLTREKLLAHLPHLSVTAPLRQTYQYNNITVILAAHALERAAGVPWEAFTREHLLTPLGMGRTAFSPAAFANDPDHCVGHRLTSTRQPESIPLRPQDAVGPAGAIWTTVNDFARFLQMQLGRGMFAGQRVISAANLAAMWQPLVAVSGPDEASFEDRAYYGMGWRIDSYRGMTRVAHGGNLNGFSSRVTLFPDQNIGMVAFSNMRGNPMAGLVTLDVMDRLMGLAPQNNSDASIARRNASEARADAAPPPAPARVAATTPSRPLPGFAGTYSDPGYGPISVTAGPDGLRASYNGMPIALDHWHFDVFKARPLGIDDGDLDGLRFNFASDDDGAITSLTVRMDEDAPAVRFVRAA